MSISNLLYDSDYMFNILSLDKINEIIGQINTNLTDVSFYSTEGTFLDLNSQTGSPLDTPKIVSYGVNKNSDNGHVTYSSGVFTINTTGYYSFKSRLRAGRSGAAGASNLFFWAEISIDDEISWNVAGTVIDVTLENSSDSKIFFDHSEIFLTAGTKLRSMFARSSTGNDSGDLIPSTPSAALQTYGLPNSPSAQITIYKAG